MTNKLTKQEKKQLDKIVNIELMIKEKQRLIDKCDIEIALMEKILKK